MEARPKWPDYDAESLRQWWNVEQLTARQCSVRFNGKYTKKEVGAKAYRMCLDRRPNPITPEGRKPALSAEERRQHRAAAEKAHTAKMNAMGLSNKGKPLVGKPGRKAAPPKQRLIHPPIPQVLKVTQPRVLLTDDERKQRERNRNKKRSADKKERRNGLSPFNQMIDPNKLPGRLTVRAGTGNLPMVVVEKQSWERHERVGGRIKSSDSFLDNYPLTYAEELCEPREVVKIAKYQKPIGECKYPTNDEKPHKFECSNSSLPGKSYCRKHWDICYPADQQRARGGFVLGGWR